MDRARFRDGVRAEIEAEDGARGQNLKHSGWVRYSTVCNIVTISADLGLRGVLYHAANPAEVHPMRSRRTAWVPIDSEDSDGEI